jgi:enterochelin esterase family protein
LLHNRGSVVGPFLEAAREIVDLAHRAQLTEELATLLEEWMPPELTVTATAWGERAVVIVRAADRPEIGLDGSEAVAMRHVPGSDYWIHPLRVRAGEMVNFGVRSAGKPLGLGISPHAVAGFGEASHPRPLVVPGELTDRRVLISDVYDGAEVEYRIYRNHGVDPEHPAPVMVWLDGVTFVGFNDVVGARVQTVTDNLAAAGIIPPMVHVFLSPGVGGRRVVSADAYHSGYFDLRILQYDEVSDEFPRHLVQEVLPDVARSVAVRDDAYSRAIFGMSSAGTAAFKTGWFRPESFGRIYSYIPSLAAWGLRPQDGIEGAHVLPLWIRSQPRRNLRIWMSAGSFDDFDREIPSSLEYEPITDPRLQGALNLAGSNALGQFATAQALKVAGYDFAFQYGTAGHNMAQMAAELPDALAWLWRDYDPALTEQRFEPSDDELRRPPFEFAITNR